MKKRIMDFLFGKKPVIYNSQGRIEHRWRGFMDRWKDRYKRDENLNWRNHSGLHFNAEEAGEEKPGENQGAAGD